MRSGGNRNSVTLSRMIKARFSRFVCPVAPYVSYFSFTSCQCSGVLFLHDVQRFGYDFGVELSAGLFRREIKLVICFTFRFCTITTLNYSRCYPLVFYFKNSVSPSNSSIFHLIGCSSL